MVDPGALSLTWEEIPTEGVGPGPRSRHSLVYDPSTGSTVFFGGIVWLGGTRHRLPDDTWELCDGRWTPIDAPQRPAGRHRAAMVFDEARGFSVLFGGEGDRQMLGDTWIYAKNRWRLFRRLLSRQPPPRCGHVMAYDANRREVILFGGINRHGEAIGDTWSFNGSWHRVDGPAPPARRYAAFAYDPRLRGCVLHGGAIDDYGHEKFGDTWLFRDDTWAPLTDKFSTDVRDDHGLAYHHEAQTLLMLEGLSARRGVLALGPSGWLPVAVEPLHYRHQCSPLTWDDRLGGLLLYGGETGHGGTQYDVTLILRTA